LPLLDGPGIHVLHYCKIIINHGVLIFLDIVVHLIPQKLKSIEIQFSH